MFVIVVGGGKVGARLVALLLAGGHRVRVVERNVERCARLRADLPGECVVAGSGTDPVLMESIGARLAEVVAAVTGADEVNLIVCSLARIEFGVQRTIARVNNPKNDWLFTPDMGVDVALSQADLMAHLIAEEMSLGEMMTLLKLRKGQYSLVEEKIVAGSGASGRMLRDLALPHECVITAIIRAGDLLIPRDDVVLRPGDEVLAVAHTAELEALAAALHG